MNKLLIFALFYLCSIQSKGNVNPPVVFVQSAPLHLRSVVFKFKSEKNGAEIMRFLAKKDTYDELKNVTKDFLRKNVLIERVPTEFSMRLVVNDNVNSARAIFFLEGICQLINDNFSKVLIVRSFEDKEARKKWVEEIENLDEKISFFLNLTLPDWNKLGLSQKIDVYIGHVDSQHDDALRWREFKVLCRFLETYSSVDEDELKVLWVRVAQIVSSLKELNFYINSISKKKFNWSKEIVDVLKRDF